MLKEQAYTRTKCRYFPSVLVPDPCIGYSGVEHAAHCTGCASLRRHYDRRMCNTIKANQMEHSQPGTEMHGNGSGPNGVALAVVWYKLYLGLMRLECTGLQAGQTRPNLKCSVKLINFAFTATIGRRSGADPNKMQSKTCSAV